MITSGFFNSLNGDRKYDAMQFSKQLDGIVDDGVYEFSNGGDAPFRVNVVSGLRVGVAPGRARFSPSWIENDAVEPFDLQMGDVYGRWDAIVFDVQTDVSVRRSTIVLIKGTPGPGNSKPTVAKPVLKNDPKWKQYPIAWIWVPRLANTIFQGDIEPAIPNEVPYVASPVGQIDLSALWSGWNAQWRAAFDSWTMYWNQFRTNMEAQRDAYFQACEAAWTTFMTNTQSSWNAYIAAKDVAWEAYLSAKNDLWNAFYTNVQSEWAAIKLDVNSFLDTVNIEWYGDPTNPELPGFKASIEQEWVIFQAEVNAWKDELLQTVVELDSETLQALARLEQKTNNINPMCTAEYNSTTNTVTITMTSEAVKKTTMTRHNIIFKSPTWFNTSHTYIFKPSAEMGGITMNIQTPKKEALKNWDWSANVMVQLIRDGENFYFQGMTSIDHKLDKMERQSTYEQAYVKKQDGTQMHMDITLPPVGYTLVKREADGNINISVDQKYNANAVSVGYLNKRDPLTLITTGTSPNYILSPNPAITSYQSGQRFRVKFHQGNVTSACTINVSGLGAKTLTLSDLATTLSTYHIRAGSIWDIEYSGTYFYLVGMQGWATTESTGVVRLTDSTTLDSSDGWAPSARALKNVASVANSALTNINAITPEGPYNWTPRVDGATANSSTTGIYCKMGPFFYFWGEFSWTGRTSSSDYFRIKGLPLGWVRPPHNMPWLYIPVNVATEPNEGFISSGEAVYGRLYAQNTSTTTDNWIGFRKVDNPATDLLMSGVSNNGTVLFSGIVMM